MLLSTGPDQEGAPGWGTTLVTCCSLLLWQWSSVRQAQEPGVVTDTCLTSEVRLAAAVLSVALQWHVSGTSVAPHCHLSGTSVAPQWHPGGSRSGSGSSGTLSGPLVAPRGVSPCGVSRAATPSQLSRPSGELDNLVLPTLCGRVRSDASVGCSGHAQRHRFGPALRLRQSAVVKRHFPPAKSFIRAGVTTRGHRFQPRIPPGSLYS